LMGGRAQSFGGEAETPVDYATTLQMNDLSEKFVFLAS